jgi:hypothetical protein
MVIGITRALNETDIIDASMMRMLTQVDHIIVGVGPSTDGTSEQLATLAAQHPITLVPDGALSWQQRDVMTGYAQTARDMGASWVVPFDVDEVWHADEGTVAEALTGLDRHVVLAPARLLTHCVTSEDDCSEADPISRMCWRSVEMLPLPKVACRALPGLRIGHGNHSASFDGMRRPAEVNGVLGARHYPYRSPEQFIKRVRGAWPQLRDSGLPESHGAHMWAYGRELDAGGPEALEKWFRDGMFFEDPASNPDLIHDPCPITPGAS